MNQKFCFKNYDRIRIKENYDKYYQKADFIQFPLAEKFFIKSLVKRYKLNYKARILDLGCGTGKYTHLFTKEGMMAIGVDFSEPAIGIARKRFPNSEFIIRDVTDLQFKRGYFNVIFCSGLSIFNEKNLSILLPFVMYLFSFLKKDGLFFFIKTTSLVDKFSKGNSRYDHSLKSYLKFFGGIRDTIVVDASVLYPHTFILMGTLAFSKVVSFMSSIITKTTKIPLRIYITLKKISD